MMSFGCLYFHIQQCRLSFTSYIKCRHFIQKCKYYMKHFTMELEIIISLYFALTYKIKNQSRKIKVHINLLEINALFIYYFPQITAVQTSMITKKKKLNPPTMQKPETNTKRPLKFLLFLSTCQGRVLSAENSSKLCWHGKLCRR